MLYIHQFPDWTRFRFDSPKVLQALGQTRLEEGKLIGIMQICGLKDIEAKLLAEDIVANYAIDGYTLDPAHTLAEVELKSKGSQNYIKNYLGAIQNASQPLTEERLFNWHSAMGQNKVLKFREVPSEVQTTIDEKQLHFAGPNPERLQSEMENFLSWFESANIDGVIKAAIAHFWFITIRPFADANGRLARAITAMQLARTENTTHCQYALNKQINNHKSDYFKILAHTQAASGDLTEWILWFLQMLRNAIKSNKSIIYDWHDPDTSYVEAILARGDRRLGRAIEEVWRRGGRLDAWSEYFDFDRWIDSVRAVGLDPDFYARRDRLYEEVLPWSMISVGVRQSYLWRERNQAYKSVITPDCRRQCMGCGADRLLCDRKCDEVLPISARAKLAAAAGEEG